MLQAVGFALIDSINLLLIGAILACGLILKNSKDYTRTTTLLILGDWLGVFTLCIIIFPLFDKIKKPMEEFLNSPIAGVIMLIIALITAIGTAIGNDKSRIIGTLLQVLRTSSHKVFIAGFILGLIQSLTSWPFYLGLAHLSIGNFSTTIKIFGLIGYTSLALSTPALAAMFVGLAIRHPDRFAGRVFQVLQIKSRNLGKGTGYFVAVVFLFLGLFSI